VDKFQESVLEKKIYDVLVIGEGVSGLTAAYALAQKGLEVATFEAGLFGGLVISICELEPALEQRVLCGAELAAELMEANSRLGIASIQKAVLGLKIEGEIKQAVTAVGIFSAHQIVIASGAKLKNLGVPGEADFEGRGVSKCAACDGPMYQKQEVVVVGGGDSALQEALVLARYCSNVHLVHRGSSFRAQKRFVEKVNKSPTISTTWNATVKAITGSAMVEGVCVELANGQIQDIPCTGIFVYIGLAPNSEFLPAAIELSNKGFVITDDKLRTTVPGIWAIGAVRYGYRGLLSDAIEEGYHVADRIYKDSK